jgi:hypothetical protein
LLAGRKIHDAREHPRLCRKYSTVGLRSIYDISLTAMVSEPESPYIVAEHHMMCFFYTWPLLLFELVGLYLGIISGPLDTILQIPEKPSLVFLSYMNHLPK